MIKWTDCNICPLFFVYYRIGGWLLSVLVLLGVVQGLCEFLPISSSGHLVLISKWFGIEDSLFVSIILHVATLLAIIVVMRKEIFYLVKHPFSKETLQLSLSTIVTCLIAIVLMPLLTESFEGRFLPWAFLTTAILLFIVEKLSFKNQKHQEFSYKHALIIGLAQGLAIFPGISRSGATISAGLLSGASREKSAKFSFLVSLPIVIGSLILEIVKIVMLGEKIIVNPMGLILSFLIAFVIGVMTIKFMLKVTARTNFKWFSIYLLIIAVISLIF